MANAPIRENYKKGSALSYEDSLQVIYGGNLHSYFLGIQSLLDLAGSFENQRVLELCCGTGLASQEIVSRRPSSFIAVDAIPSFVSFAENRVRKSLAVPLEQEPRFFCRDIFSLLDPGGHKTVAPADMVVISNATTEIYDTEKLFSLVYQVLDHDSGVFLFNTKIKDQKKNVYQMVFETLVEFHQRNKKLSQSQSLDGLMDGRIVYPEFEGRELLSLLSKQGFRVQICQKSFFSFSARQLEYYIYRIWRDYKTLLGRIYGPGDDDSHIPKWVCAETDSWFYQFVERCCTQPRDYSHMKTELFVRAEKGSLKSYSTLLH